MTQNTTQNYKICKACNEGCKKMKDAKEASLKKNGTGMSI